MNPCSRRRAGDDPGLAPSAPQLTASQPGHHGAGQRPTRVQRRKTKRERNSAKFGRKVADGPGCRMLQRMPAPGWSSHFAGHAKPTPLPAIKRVSGSVPVIITQHRLSQHLGMFNREVKSADIERLLDPRSERETETETSAAIPGAVSQAWDPCAHGQTCAPDRRHGTSAPAPHAAGQGPQPTARELGSTHSETAAVETGESQAELPAPLDEKENVPPSGAEPGGATAAMRELAQELQTHLDLPSTFPGRNLISERRQTILSTLLDRHQTLPDLSALMAHNKPCGGSAQGALRSPGARLDTGSSGSGNSEQGISGKRRRGQDVLAFRCASPVHTVIKTPRPQPAPVCPTLSSPSSAQPLSRPGGHLTSVSNTFSWHLCRGGGPGHQLLGDSVRHLGALAPSSAATPPPDPTTWILKNCLGDTEAPTAYSEKTFRTFPVRHTSQPPSLSMQGERRATRREDLESLDTREPFGQRSLHPTAAPSDHALLSGSALHTCTIATFTPAAPGPLPRAAQCCGRSWEAIWEPRTRLERASTAFRPAASEGHGQGHWMPLAAGDSGQTLGLASRSPAQCPLAERPQYPGAHWLSPGLWQVLQTQTESKRPPLELHTCQSTARAAPQTQTQTSVDVLKSIWSPHQPSQAAEVLAPRALAWPRPGHRAVSWELGSEPALLPQACSLHRQGPHLEPARKPRHATGLLSVLGRPRDHGQKPAAVEPGRAPTFYQPWDSRAAAPSTSGEGCPCAGGWESRFPLGGGQQLPMSFFPPSEALEHGRSPPPTLHGYRLEEGSPEAWVFPRMKLY
ncbi:proline-rich protein 19 [Pangshura tecta]